MSTLRTYAQLGTVYRGDPCVEYPGVWLVYVKGEQVGAHATLEAALTQAHHLHDTLYRNVSVCWAASDDDPRVGQVWFTGFYCHTFLRGE